MTRDRRDKSGLIRRKPGSRSSGYIGQWPVDRAEMNSSRFVVVVTAVVLVAAVLPAAALPIDDGAAVGASQATATNASMAPGETFAGAIGVQHRELAGEVETRAYGRSIAAARSAAGKATVVANRTRALERRLGELRERRQQLVRAHENGSISDGRFRAELVQLAAQVRTVERLANQSRATAQDLPASVRDRHGINVTAIDQLRRSARTMTGPEVAAMARRIAGASLDRPVDRPGPAVAPVFNATEPGDGPGLQPGTVTNGGSPGPINETNRTDGPGQ